MSQINRCRHGRVTPRFARRCVAYHVFTQLRQKFSCGSAFQPTSNPRCFQMYRELQNHSKLIAGLQKQVKRLETSTEGDRCWLILC